MSNHLPPHIVDKLLAITKDDKITVATTKDNNSVCQKYSDGDDYINLVAFMFAKLFKEPSDKLLVDIILLVMASPPQYESWIDKHLVAIQKKSLDAEKYEVLAALQKINKYLKM